MIELNPLMWLTVWKKYINKYIAKEYVVMYIEDGLQGTEQNIDTTHSQ